MLNKTKLYPVILFAFIGIQITQVFAHDMVGKVILLKGVVTAKVDGQPACRLSKGADIYLQDELETHNDGFLVIKLNNNRKLTMQPGSILQVQADDKAPEQASNAVKNALRNLSGLIGQSRPVARNETRTTTIGIRGPLAVLPECTDRESLVAGEPANID